MRSRVRKIIVGLYYQMNSNITIVKQTVTAKARKLTAGWTIDEYSLPKYIYKGLTGLFEPQWHKIIIYDVMQYEWLRDQNTELWDFHVENDSHLTNTFNLHPTLYTIFLLKFGE